MPYVKAFECINSGSGGRIMQLPLGMIISYLFFFPFLQSILPLSASQLPSLMTQWSATEGSAWPSR